MTDRELLERAARAAGMELVLWHADGTPHAARPGGTVSFRWNPLTDDADALRLAVRLGIAVQMHPAWVYARAVSPSDHYNWMEITEGWGNSTDPSAPYAAARRAIVRAAATVQPAQPAGGQTP